MRQNSVAQFLQFLKHLLCTMQSGNVGRDILTLCSHTDILEAARADADRIMNDPEGTDLGFVNDYMDEVSSSDNSDII